MFKIIFNEDGPALHDTGMALNEESTFIVDTGDLPNDGKNYVIGFGKRNGPDSPVIAACAIISARPNTRQAVVPIIELFFSSTPATPGDLIDYNDLAGKSAKIRQGY
ncbi:hypothetical protein BO78DRAFT_420364 [Aspergillus sclerotiicarbonarius CBS 121057]|uniref:Uncharacterized protein n=1 Tax=Aspergillus sclerotiicarbonarius (strain CBS 121057 / IBT 28362) TaxID=1448318 RepID=A0A319E3Q0_ASPSB|nr:hypothetical protein BO78DRAFT_420364 [Aspergillus sclerotiicarbonarius CBS 121057]